MEYQKIIEKYDDDFDFEPKFVSKEEFTVDCVFDQDPKAGKSVKKGSKIILFVASSEDSSGIEIPDFADQDYTVAESKLKSLGFIVNVLKEYSEDVEMRHVIRTEPEAGSLAPVGSIVKLFVATNQNVEPVVVPNLVGKHVSEAREILEGLGLVAAVEEHENRQPYGTVLGCSEVGESVLPGTIITLFVSNGKDPQRTTETTETTEEETTEEKTTKEDKTTEPSTTKPTTTKPTTTKPTTEPTTEYSTTKRQTTLPAETTTKPTTPPETTTTKQQVTDPPVENDTTQDTPQDTPAEDAAEE